MAPLPSRSSQSLNELVTQLIKGKALASGDLRSSFREILHVCAEGLRITRVGIWLYGDQKTKIRCVASYDSRKKDFVVGTELLAIDFPKYFGAIESERIINANDAHRDPRTIEFTDVYLIPLGISSMLDAPIYWEGNMIGVICCEHTGQMRRWTVEEEYFGTAIANLISLIIEAWGRKEAEKALSESKRQLEEKVKERTRQLQESNEELQRFAYAASHDLKEPLRTIMGFAQLLDRHYAQQIDNAGKEYIQFIYNSIKNMNLLLNDLLAYSRVIQKPDEGFQMCDIYMVFETVQLNLRRQIADSQASVEFPKNLPKIYAVYSKMVQLFQNLISNALKFIPEEQPPVIYITYKETSTHYQFGVHDNGIGIEPAYQQQIFTLFKRLHSKQEYEGSGIGLNLCKRIVEQHNGEIWVESTFGSGSSFYFTLAKSI